MTASPTSAGLAAVPVTRTVSVSPMVRTAGVAGTQSRLRWLAVGPAPATDTAPAQATAPSAAGARRVILVSAWEASRRRGISDLLVEATGHRVGLARLGLDKDPGPSLHGVSEEPGALRATG